MSASGLSVLFIATTMGTTNITYKYKFSINYFKTSKY